MLRFDYCLLQLLDLASGAPLVQLYQKGMSKDAWPALQLSSDEEQLAHMVNNNVNIYKLKAFAEGKSNAGNDVSCQQYP